MGKQTRGRRSTTLGRIFKTGFVNFFRNISLSVAATAVMVVTLTIVLFFVIANATFNHSIQYRADNKDNLELLQAVSQTDNPLPATIQVKPKDPTRNEEIKAILETP